MNTDIKGNPLPPVGAVREKKIVEVFNGDVWIKSRETVIDSERELWASDIVDSEPFMWLMAGSNHVEAQLSALRPAYNRYCELGGGYGKA